MKETRKIAIQVIFLLCLSLGCMVLGLVSQIIRAYSSPVIWFPNFFSFVLFGVLFLSCASFFYSIGVRLKHKEELEKHEKTYHLKMWKELQSIDDIEEG